MTFKHNNDFQFEELPTTNVDGKRHYISPSGKILPSVTTVLYQEEKKEITKWKKRIGEEKAEYVKKAATDRGNIIHSICEDYLQNKPVEPIKMMPKIRALFVSVRPFLDSINTIYAQEACLYSDEIGIAGRVDLIATDKHGLLSVIDFKGSTRVKEEKYLADYYTQTAAYAALWTARTGILIKNAYVVVATEEIDRCDIFQLNPLSYLPRLKTLIKKYNHK